MPDMPAAPVADKAGWSSAELARDESWKHRLGTAENAEISDAIKAVRRRELGPFRFAREDFPLPTLGPRLAAIGEELESGVGVALIRGLDLEPYDVTGIFTIYWGLAVHLGVPISQNARGELIAHVTDSGRDYQAKNVRGYTTRAALRPHCDPSDVVGLLCIHPAKSGGDSVVASAVAVHNAIMRRRPDLLPYLYEGFHFDLRGEGRSDDPDEVTDHRVPVFSWFADRLSCRYNGKTIEDGMRKARMPLDGPALEAVRLVGELAMAPEFRYDLRMERGDIQLLSNHSVLHARTAFEDHPDPALKRDLLRLWLNLRNGRPLAPAFADRLNSGPRGGVHVRPGAA